MWEDLCELEGRLGMRYLTHESEDAFWRRQGAKPHPLIKKVAANPPPMTNYYVNIHTIHEQIAAAANSSDLDSSSLDQQVPNGTSQASRAPNKPPSSTTNNETACVSPDSDSKRKSYVALPDEEVTLLHEHAQRIGYTVSTV